MTVEAARRIPGAMVRLIVVLVVCTGVMSCNSDEPSVTVPTYKGVPNGDDAALIGTIVVDEPCFFVEVEGGDRLLIAFPEKTTDWDDAARELTLSGRTFKVGDRVLFGGSGAGRDPNTFLDWATTPSPDCEASEFWISQATARMAADVP